MNVILDPGALLAAQLMSPDRAFSAMPHAPVIPDPLPAAARLRRVRAALAGTLESLAGRVRPYEPPVCRPAVPGR